MNLTLIQHTALVSVIGGQELLIILIILAIPIIIVIAIIKVIINATKSSRGQVTHAKYPSAEDRLRSLKALHSDGTITDEEYQHMRSKVMSEL